MEQQQSSADQTSGATKVYVRAFRMDQRIGVALERHGWVRHFTIQIKDGVLPEEYREDPQIVAAYERCRAHYEKWEAKKAAQQMKSGEDARDAKLMDRAEMLLDISERLKLPLSGGGKNKELDAAIKMVQRELGKPSREFSNSAFDAIYDAEFEVIAPDGQRWKIRASGSCEGFPQDSVILNGLLPPINRLISEVIVSGRACATE